MNQQPIETLLTSAVNQLIEEQPELLESDVSERALTHHLANYIAHRVRLNHNYHVDVEYNRNGIDPKRLNLTPRSACDDELKAITAFPDIIIHRRGVNTDNLLVLEIKKPNPKPKELQYDAEKLRAFRNQLGYKYAAHVIMGDAKPIQWILD